MNDSVKPWDLLNPNKPKSPEEVQQQRLEICKSCDFFIDILRKCSKCGCIMPLKATLSQAKCPIGKWGKYE